jgi:predicted RNA polymerase sigma factor
MKSAAVAEAAVEMDPAETLDWQLRLMFACAHPAIDMGVRGQLILQTKRWQSYGQAGASSAF